MREKNDCRAVLSGQEGRETGMKQSFEDKLKSLWSEGRYRDIVAAIERKYPIPRYPNRSDLPVDVLAFSDMAKMKIREERTI